MTEVFLDTSVIIPALLLVVMWQRAIGEALAADRHFRQAEFRPLLAPSGS
jgi:hypothetical protein